MFTGSGLQKQPGQGVKLHKPEPMLGHDGIRAAFAVGQAIRVRESAEDIQL
jgi:hypothetical protein